MTEFFKTNKYEKITYLSLQFGLIFIHTILNLLFALEKAKISIFSF